MNCRNLTIFSLESSLGEAEGLERGEAPRGGMKEELHQKVVRVRVGTQNAQRSERHVLGYAECFGIVRFKQTSLILLGPCDVCFI